MTGTNSFDNRPPILSGDLAKRTSQKGIPMDEEIIAVVAVSLIFGGPVLAIIIKSVLKTVERMARDHQETVLRMKMVDRGYSATEIERVCRLPESDRQRAAVDDWVPVMPAKPAKV